MRDYSRAPYNPNCINQLHSFAKLGFDPVVPHSLPNGHLDLSRLRVFPLSERRSLTALADILVEPESPPPSISDALKKQVLLCANRIRKAHESGAGVMLIYGAHLLRNGAAGILDQMMSKGWLTHLATNGAGTIHDWEYSWLGRSTESVRDNVATGSFGTWDETGRSIHLALVAGGLVPEGYGRALGRFIDQDGIELPEIEALSNCISKEPNHPLTPARADCLRIMREHGLKGGFISMPHAHKHGSILHSAFAHDIPFSVHPGIGYDIVSCHPMFNGAVIGRAAEQDFKLFAGSVDTLDGGVVLSVGSAIMGPQVFEKSLSCVNNLRLQAGGDIVKNHSIFVVDLQDGGGWDWTAGEPPKSNPAYYLRFCKSFARMGGEMHYLQADNLSFVHNLWHALKP